MRAGLFVVIKGNVASEIYAIAQLDRMVFGVKVVLIPPCVRVSHENK